MTLEPEIPRVDDEHLVVDAGDPGAPARRRRGGLIVLLLVLGVLVLGAGAAGAVWWIADARERALAARTVTDAQQAAIAAALDATAGEAEQLETSRIAYREAVARWDAAVATAEGFKADSTTPSPSAPNPGGNALPGGDGDARALLDGVGGSAVQIVYDGGPQNCGYTAAEGQYQVALGGCYDSRFRNTVFLAWDSGARRSDIWPIFVHEAMHWYQWDRFATYFAAADQVGVGQDAYRAQIESDASCRAVVQHGIATSAYASSSAPCDVDGWHENWLVEQLAGLGVPTAAPDPEEFEVREVVRP